MSRCWLLFSWLIFTSLTTALRAVASSPAVVQTLPTETLGLAGSNQTLNLYSYIQDPNVPGTAVRMSVLVGNLSSGNIDIALDDTETPQTVANFLAYINAGYYTNNIVHRSVPGFIIQGGEYYFPTSTQLSYVPTFSEEVPNEPGNSNVAGTIAMAKVSGNVNSATDQWFINLVDNSGYPNYLDTTNGGYTVFGQIINNGLTVANAIANVTVYNGTSVAPDWTNIPLASSTVANSNGFIMSAFVITSMAVVPAVTYGNVSSSNTSLVTVSLSGNTLTFKPSTTNIGNTTVTVTTTDLEGAQLQTSINVTVVQPYSNWIAPDNFSTALALPTANPSGDGVPNLLKFAFGGNPLVAQRAPGLPQAESGGGVTFYQRQLAGLSYEVDESFDLVTWTKIWQTSDGIAASPVVAHTTVTGFDVLTIRDPAVAPLRFWRVQVSETL